MALTGDSFCDAARDGFNLVIKKFGQYVVIQHVGGLYTFAGVLLIATATGILGFCMMNAAD